MQILFAVPMEPLFIILVQMCAQNLGELLLSLLAGAYIQPASRTLCYKTPENDSVPLLVAGLLKDTSALHLLPDSASAWPLGGSLFGILHNLSIHTYTDGTALFCQDFSMYLNKTST